MKQSHIDMSSDEGSWRHRQCCKVSALREAQAAHAGRGMRERFPAVPAPRPAHEVERARVGGGATVARQGESAGRSGGKRSVIVLIFEAGERPPDSCRASSPGDIDGEARGQRNRQRSAGGSNSSDKHRRATEHVTTRKQVRERSRH